ncbi:hypothetical protein FNYG_15277 [Fusarium nygamai]|uniref:Peptidase A2 domain-containing protein n=1 Tax=Gibberella nygamai TaxID=42673 RepID=A0A2K0UHD5_GIBNY|nr:hypothetical protein FNYG_15277 [Fusarium nygamai]
MREDSQERIGKSYTLSVTELQMSQYHGRERLGPTNTLGVLRTADSADSLVLRVQIKERWLNAWIDCGAKRNFIDPKIVTELRLPWRKKSLPYPLVNAEGQLFDYNDGIIDQETDHLNIFIEGQNQQVDFDIIPLGEDVHMILGMSWLIRENPHIDWRNGQVTFPNDPESDAKTITTNNERSQTLTKEDGMGKRGTERPPPLKGVRHEHKRGIRNKTEILGILKE